MKPAHSIALVDCNNFYVSCERLFRPDLAHQPVAVLSNNDGCIVARSQEVKALGIKMATPVHQVQNLIKRHGIHLFSSNYALYANLSNRVMQTLESFTPELEIYSIDESFLNLSGLCEQNQIAYGQKIKQTVLRDTGIPVSVGIAPNKTLAKLANHVAKKWPKTAGIVDLSEPERCSQIMRRITVNDIWGIGRQIGQRLQQMGIHTAYELAQQPVESIHAQFNVVLARTVMELNGVACLSLEEITPDKQQIVCSRSFKQRLTDYTQLEQALTCFAARAAEKLRKQDSVAGSINIYINTNPFNPKEPQYQQSAYLAFPQLTADSRQIIKTARLMLQSIFKSGYRYHHCAIQLWHIQPAAPPDQLDLFKLTHKKQERSEALMQSIDQINQKFPRSISVSTSNLKQDWQCQLKYRSQGYTTNWNELAVVQCH